MCGGWGTEFQAIAPGGVCVCGARGNEYQPIGQKQRSGSSMVAVTWLEICTQQQVVARRTFCPQYAAMNRVISELLRGRCSTTLGVERFCTVRSTE